MGQGHDKQSCVRLMLSKREGWQGAQRQVGGADHCVGMVEGRLSLGREVGACQVTFRGMS